MAAELAEIVLELLSCEAVSDSWKPALIVALHRSRADDWPSTSHDAGAALRRLEALDLVGIAAGRQPISPDTMEDIQRVLEALRTSDPDRDRVTGDQDPCANERNSSGS